VCVFASHVPPTSSLTIDHRRKSEGVICCSPCGGPVPKLGGLWKQSLCTFKGCLALTGILHPYSMCVCLFRHRIVPGGTRTLICMMQLPRDIAADQSGTLPPRFLRFHPEPVCSEDNLLSRGRLSDNCLLWLTRMLQSSASVVPARAGLRSAHRRNVGIEPTLSTISGHLIRLCLVFIHRGKATGSSAPSET
jgi:hypothetical protein